MQAAEDPTYRKYLKALAYGVARCFPLRPNNSLQAAALCQALANNGIASTLGRLSKAGDDPGEIVREYQGASNSLAAAEDFYLSVKPPALSFDPSHALAIVATALKNGHSVHFDAHGFAYADPTFRMLQAVLEATRPGRGRGWTFGLTLPSRWKRSISDALWVAEMGIRPRLVKGDFKANAVDEVEPVQGLLTLVDALAGEVKEIALATHDCSMAREVVRRCGEKGTAVQFELFFGMPSSNMLALSRELKVPCRFYIPYGDTLLVYVVRDLLTNPHKVLRPNSLELLGSQEQKLARILGLR